MAPRGSTSATRRCWRSRRLREPTAPQPTSALSRARAFTRPSRAAPTRLSHATACGSDREQQHTAMCTEIDELLARLPELSVEERGAAIAELGERVGRWRHELAELQSQRPSSSAKAIRPTLRTTRIPTSTATSKAVRNRIAPAGGIRRTRITAARRRPSGQNGRRDKVSRYERRVGGRCHRPGHRYSPATGRRRAVPPLGGPAQLPDEDAGAARARARSGPVPGRKRG